MDPKAFSSALSKNKNWRKALEEVSSQIKEDLQGKTCDLLIFFVSESYQNFEIERFLAYLAELVPHRVRIGCNSSGVIGRTREIEMEAAVSLLAMHLPGVKINSFYVSGENSAMLATGADLINFIDVYPPDKPRFICLADPMNCDVVKLLHAFNDGYKGLPVIGGLASGGVMNVPNWLCLGANMYTEGAVGVALVGEIEFEILVSQGCRPIGKPFVITKAEDHMLYELGGRTALSVVREILENLAPPDKKLAEQSLSVGLVMNEQQTSFKRGDFLIRNFMGFDPDTEALMIGAALHVGQTLQFQVRDAETSEEDLRILLGKMHEAEASRPQGGLLVSCCGRGNGLYGKPDHDISAIQAIRGPMPLAGFFANGEIGPVGGKNFVHGFTSSLVIFR